LRKPADLDISGVAKSHLDRVNLEISPADVMFAGSIEHYLSCGASALNAIAALLQLAQSNVPRRILDFGAGAGRVTRWLRAVFPDAELEACDVREADVAFCREHFGVTAWASSTEIGALSAPHTYDLIWAGSVLTHIAAEDAKRVLRRWVDWTNPGGLTISTTHGRAAVEFAASGRVTYFNEPERWQRVLEGYEAAGYGYEDYADWPWPGYGVSLTSLEWIARVVESWPDVRLVAVCERGWDQHQDVVALQKVC
jgi:SAM-dependent methyltransferase